ncbi:MAG: hypothetical protein PHV74_07810 [Dehalococcoidia bacterium]|nr:hypothetical protein [Dehalococcoidia bacterium]
MKETAPAVKPSILLAMELVAVVFVLLVLATGSFLNVAESTKATEKQAIEYAVVALRSEAGGAELDGDYHGVNTWTDAQMVRAGGGTYNLAEFMGRHGFPLKQSYDISRDGMVSVTSEE